MPILGLSINEIRASKKAQTSPKIDINSSISIKDLKEIKVNFPNLERCLSIDFEFLTTYKPEIAEIKIVGSVLYTDSEQKKILKDWRKNKKLPEKTDIEIKNFLLRKCLILGINLSAEMNVPPPIAFPIVLPKEKIEK